MEKKVLTPPPPPTTYKNNGITIFESYLVTILTNTVDLKWNLAEFVLKKPSHTDT